MFNHLFIFDWYTIKASKILLSKKQSSFWYQVYFCRSLYREACGINLKNSVVIIDEAHNVLETIAHMHSAEVSQAHIEHAQSQVKNYFKKFQKMLKAKNLLYIKHILTVLAKQRNW